MSRMAKNATQGTETFRGRVAARAVDGNHDPDIRNPYCAQAIDGRVAFVNVWWAVDLGATYVVLGVNIANLDESECGSACPGWSSTFQTHTGGHTCTHTHTHTHTHTLHPHLQHNEPPSLTWINIKPCRDKSTYVQECYNGCTLKFENR